LQQKEQRMKKDRDQRLKKLTDEEKKRKNGAELTELWESAKNHVDQAHLVKPDKRKMISDVEVTETGGEKRHKALQTIDFEAKYNNASRTFKPVIIKGPPNSKGETPVNFKGYTDTVWIPASRLQQTDTQCLRGEAQLQQPGMPRAGGSLDYGVGHGGTYGVYSGEYGGYRQGYRGHNQSYGQSYSSYDQGSSYSQGSCDRVGYGQKQGYAQQVSFYPYSM